MKIPACKTNKFYALPEKLPRISRSRYWLVLMASLYCLVFVAVFIADIAQVTQYLCLALVFGCGSKTALLWWHTPVFYMQYRANTFYLQSEGSDTGYYSRRYEMLGWHFWSFFLLVMIVKCPQGKIILFPVGSDSCSKEDFRRLKVLVIMLQPA